MRKALITISILLLAGCSLVYARLTYDFAALPENNQIFYEAGAQDLAKLAAAELAISINKVEKLQFLPFKNREAIKVYVFKYITNIPGWFLEGLAVSVSSGGGAENVTEAQAQAYIRNTVRFVPDDSGRIIGHKTAHNYGLEPQMYYRQASLFVEYLQKTNPGAFEGSLVDLVNGAIFREVWPKHYGHTIFELWRNFEKSIGA